jgi:uncharacterized membrane protein
MILLQKHRLEALTDGVFAIIMTILVLEVKVPEILLHPSNTEAVQAIYDAIPLILSFFTSFSILGTYWMGHNFIFQNYVKHMNRELGYLNMFFLMMCSLIPFSAHFLGNFYQYSASIVVYAINVILIGFSLLILRNYILSKRNICYDNISKKDVIHGTIRIFMPPIFAVFSILISGISTQFSLLLFAVPVIFNIVPGGLNFIENKFVHKKQN